MGWNDGYTIFEATVIGAYDLGKLDRELLDVLMEPYRGTDIDAGGKVGLKTKDGKEVEQVAIETFGLTMPKAPAMERPDWRSDLTPAEQAAEDAWDAYVEEVDERFSEIRRHYGWW